jgi:hypothetical protein
MHYMDVSYRGGNPPANSKTFLKLPLGYASEDQVRSYNEKWGKSLDTDSLRCKQYMYICISPKGVKRSRHSVTCINVCCALLLLNFILAITALEETIGLSQCSSKMISKLNKKNHSSETEL